MIFPTAAIAVLVMAFTFQGPQIPSPQGMVNDFANVISAEDQARIERLAQIVRGGSQGEIAVVTLPDLEGRDVGDVALRIGREWGVGAASAIGDESRNAGVVVLLVPRETSGDGRGYISIQVGQGAEGFITDGQAGDIRREATPMLSRGEYGPALTLITARLAERYSAAFGFPIDDSLIPEPTRRETRIPAIFFIIFIFVIISIVSSANRRGGGGGRGGGGVDPTALLLATLLSGSNRSRGGGFGGGGFGGGGFGGGGFGGFGGGGGFSGGGSSGSF